MKSKRFYAILIFVIVVLALVLSSYLFTNIKIPETVNGFYLSPVSLLAVLFLSIIGSIFGGDIVSGDKEKNYSNFISSLPFSKKKLFIAKYIASLIALSGIIVIYYLITFLVSIFIYGKTTLAFGEAFLITLLYSAGWLSLSAFVGSFFKKPSTSLISAIVVNFFVLETVGSIIAKATNWPAWIILNYTGYSIEYLLQTNPGTISFSTSIGLVKMALPNISYSLITMVLYVIIFFVGSFIIYIKREA